MRIFVVEDDLRVLELLRKGLSESGFEVTTAADGDTGLSFALAHRYDAIVLDIGLPGRSGMLVTAEISVTDRGTGISPEDQTRIFERFCHRARPIHGAFSGSGLGLALGQWIAMRHKTAINLQSAFGEGSRFSFVLPKEPFSLSEGSLTIGRAIANSYS
jgi:signal transduction histidine kinase